MRKLFEFECEQCGIFEELTEYTNKHDCPICGKVAYKVISTPSIQLEGVSGSFPGAALSWEKKHWDRTRAEQKKAAED